MFGLYRRGSESARSETVKSSRHGRAAAARVSLIEQAIEALDRRGMGQPQVRRRNGPDYISRWTGRTDKGWFWYSQIVTLILAHAGHRLLLAGTGGDAIAVGHAFRMLTGFRCGRRLRVALMFRMESSFTRCFCGTGARDTSEGDRRYEELKEGFLRDHYRDTVYPYRVFVKKWEFKMTGNEKPRQAIGRRLNRIEGQVRGLGRMLDEDRYCIDILQQIQAVKAALKKAETELLRVHASECIEHALASGTVSEKRKKIVELVDLFERVR